MKSILQTPEWAQFKKSQGWEIINLGEVFIHKRSLPLGQNFLYLPEVSADDISPSQIEELKEITKEQKSIFTRLELIDHFNENSYKLIRSFGFDKAFEQVQPKWRQIINLDMSEEELLNQMKPKGRYNIKIAQKHQVEVKSEKLPARSAFSTADAGGKVKSEIQNSKLKNFYDLYSETVKREGITGRSLKYFADMIDSFKETDYLEIYIASYRDRPIAAALISFYPDTLAGKGDGTGDRVASYLYGGSSREEKQAMAPYLLHWQIIKDAKERLIKKYDMIGRDEPEKQGKWAGVTRFKEQFGGEAVEILGSFDYVNKPLAYKLFKMAEKVRRK